MIPKFRAWIKEIKLMANVNLINLKCKSLVFDFPNGAMENINFEDCVLMQSTGVKDKNGVKIFEGDIVVIHFSNYQPIKGIVTFINGGFAVKTKREGTHYLSTWDKEKFEVVGNIYENTY